MIRKSIQEELGRILSPGQIRYQEPMDRHCSFRTGGPADAMVFVRTRQELADVLRLLTSEGEEWFILGRGTNLLVGDGGYRGVIVTAVSSAGEEETAHRPGEDAPRQDDRPVRLDEVRVEKNMITAGAGATLHEVSLAAAEHGLAGMEVAAGIPGTVGGGLVMNAGAYGGEMKQVVRSVHLLSADIRERELGPEEMQFGYRTSLLRKISAVALSAQFELIPDDPVKIRQKIADLAAQRREKQPLEYPSAGSTFKRPEGYFAGKLIMDAGLRGYSVGGAQVSEKHCGFVINRGGALSAQIRALIEDVQERVFRNSGVMLEREVIYLGEF